MKKLDNIKQIQVSEITIPSCEFCNKTFKKHSTLFSHICERKQRWIDRDTKQSKIAFYLWDTFYSTMFISKSMKRTVLDFIKNQYYSAFIKFAKYGIEQGIIDIELYFDWLIENKVRIDDWTLDSNYLKFLYNFLRTEHHLDAINRTIKNLSNEVGKSEINSNIMKEISSNRLCFMLSRGSISPWFLYNSDCGLEFLSSLNESQLQYVFNYIDPDKWTLKMRLNESQVNEVKELLKKKGL